MRICRTLTNLLPIFAVDGSSLAVAGTGADAAVDVAVGGVGGVDGGGVTFAVDIGISFFTAVGGVVVDASLLFDFDLIVTKLVSDVCSGGFFVNVGVLEPVVDGGADDIGVFSGFAVGDALLDRVLIADLSREDAIFGGRDFLSVAVADAAARVFGRLTLTDVTFPKPNGFVLFSVAAAAVAWLRVSFVGEDFCTTFAVARVFCGFVGGEDDDVEAVWFCLPTPATPSPLARPTLLGLGFAADGCGVCGSGNSTISSSAVINSICSVYSIISSACVSILTARPPTFVSLSSILSSFKFDIS